MTEMDQIKTIRIKGIKDESNRFAAMLELPGARHNRKLDVKILNSMDEINSFVRLWQLEAIRNHCDFVIDQEVPYFPERTLPIEYQVAGSLDALPFEVRESSLQPVSS